MVQKQRTSQDTGVAVQRLAGRICWVRAAPGLATDVLPEVSQCYLQLFRVGAECVLSKKVEWAHWKKEVEPYENIAKSVLKYLDAKPHSILEFGSGLGTNLQHFYENGVGLCVGLEPVPLGKLGWYTNVEDSIQGPLQFPFHAMQQESTFRNFKHHVLGDCNATFDTILILNEGQEFLKQPACPVLNFLTSQSQSKTTIVSAELTMEKWQYGNHSQLRQVNLTHEWISRGFKVLKAAGMEMRRLPAGYPSWEGTFAILQATSQVSKINCLVKSPKVTMDGIHNQTDHENQIVPFFFTEANEKSRMSKKGRNGSLSLNLLGRREMRKNVTAKAHVTDTEQCIGPPMKLSVAIVTIHPDRAQHLVRHYNSLCIVSDVLVVLNKWTWPLLRFNTTYKKPVTIVLERNNTLRNRYRHSELLLSSFVLLSDDDYKFDSQTLLASLELLSTKPYAVVGYSRRCVKWTTWGWKYGSHCRKDTFHMGLGQARVIHKHWMESFLGLPGHMLDFIDSNKPTCEDITFYFMVGNITRYFPVSVMPILLQPCKKGKVGDGKGMHNTIKGWGKQRTSCINRLAQGFGGMMLRNNTGIFSCKALFDRHLLKSTPTMLNVTFR
eukprot:scaffold499_cov335-Pavlova_lutheri.AAC.44